MGCHRTGGFNRADHSNLPNSKVYFGAIEIVQIVHSLWLYRPATCVAIRQERILRNYRAPEEKPDFSE
jgi:hypothetical protein